MDNFKEATRLKLRISTSQGILSTEQLWDLSLTKLSIIIKNVKKTLQNDNDDELSFLDEAKVVNSENKLVFDVLKDIYLTKKQELDSEKNIAENKANNEKILAIIHQKQENKLADLSVEELTAMLK